ncbi:biotin--[acetyl-CoA-carboxylase] ligase [Microcella sp.]|uniref:biotin--[acetyl-CoA-carboxylase] ligase n=1 Tax=Microcella sp. TaxID=1913979 RepID=UPI00391C512D
MQLPLSRAISPALDWRDRCSSTNTELVARAAELPDLAVIATTDQTAGRGRLGRDWSAPPGSALAISMLVRLEAVPDPRRWGWLPLVAGVAVVRAVRSLGVEGAGLKWPNDVLVDDAHGLPRKLSGILTELAPEGVVIGAGLNLSMTHDELPVATATSLALQGVPVDGDLADRALAATLRELRAIVAQWRSAGSPAELRAIVEPELRTIGRAVRIDRPGLDPLLGTALGLDDDGRLRVRPLGEGDEIIAVAAGDVTHLRYE